MTTSINTITDWSNSTTFNSNNYILNKNLTFTNTTVGNIILDKDKTFDGNSKTIYLNNITNFNGLFSLTTANIATQIKNLKIICSNVTLNDNKGILINGSMNRTITSNGNVQNVDIIFKNGIFGSNCGGIVGAGAINMNMDGCYFDVGVNGIINSRNGGGLFGANTGIGGTINIFSSFVKGIVDGNTGGLVGNSSTITNIVNSYLVNPTTGTNAITLSGSSVNSITPSVNNFIQDLITSPNNTSTIQSSINIALNREYQINNQTIANSTSLGTGIVNSSLTSVGTLTSLTISGQESIINTTQSTSTSTGALIVSGGVGIGANLNVGGNLNVTNIERITDSTQSTSTSTGALIVSGGVGIGANLNVGGNLNVTNIERITDSTQSTSTSTGALIVSGGVGIGANLNVGGNLNVTNIERITNTTQSTSSTTGALIVSGGVGIGGNLNVNTNFSVNGIGPFGIRNRFINGAFNIDQRNSGASTSVSVNSSAFTADRWYVNCTGAAVTVQRNEVTNGTQQYKYSLVITGAASNTATYLGQRIESENCYDLVNQNVVVSFMVSSTSITSLSCTAYYPNTENNYNTKIQIATTTFTISSTQQLYQWTFNAGSNVYLGLLIEFSTGALLSGNSITFRRMQCEQGTIASFFEIRPTTTELNLCQRYYVKSDIIEYYFYMQVNGGQSNTPGWPIFFPVNMYANPNITFSSISAVNISTPILIIRQNYFAFTPGFTPQGSTNGRISFSYIASAEF
jgi:hypothetical protein